MEAIGFRDCLLYLFGNRDAIRKLARSDKSLYLGAFFILITSICREYDQELLVSSPIPFLLPFVASVVICLLVRGACFGNYRKSLNREGLGSFRAFLSLFWLTAPCAWIYAFPAEALFDSVTAIKINLSILGLVTVWRVWLFSRVMKILTDVNILWSILAIAMPIIIVASSFVSISIVGVMGGGQTSEEQDIILAVNGFVSGGALILVIPIWIISFFHSRKLQSFISLEKVRAATCNRSLIVICLLLLSGAIGMMVPGQIKLNRIERFEKILAQDKYDDAITFANQFEANQFPATRKIYPPLHYYGFETAMALFGHMKGDEKEWLKNDVEKWVSRGLQSSWYYGRNTPELLKDCPVTDYHLGFFKLHKAEIKKRLERHEYDELQSITNWTTALEIEMETKPKDSK